MADQRVRGLSWDQEAVAEVKRALDIEPTYVPARRELHRLLGMLN